MRYIIVIVIVLLSLVNVLILHTTYRYAKSGPIQYIFEEPDFMRDEINIRIHEFNTTDELYIAISPFLSTEDYYERYGFSMWSTIDNTCDIYVTRPVNDDDFNTWGHELAHCVYGNWHRTQQD